MGLNKQIGKGGGWALSTFVFDFFNFAKPLKSPHDIVTKYDAIITNDTYIIMRQHHSLGISRGARL